MQSPRPEIRTIWNLAKNDDKNVIFKQCFVAVEKTYSTLELLEKCVR